MFLIADNACNPQPFPASGGADPPTPCVFRALPPMCRIRVGSPILGFGITRVSCVPSPISYLRTTCSCSSDCSKLHLGKLFAVAARETASAERPYTHSCCRREVGCGGCQCRSSMRRWGGGNRTIRVFNGGRYPGAVRVGGWLQAQIDLLRDGCGG